MAIDTLQILREALSGTEYEGGLFLVGGFVRDKLLGKPADAADLDLVLEGDALAVADLLWKKRVSEHKPVLYPKFGTAMVHVAGSQVELVTARVESYERGSRKPNVTPGTLRTDAQRRDFTINTFLENLTTGEILDPLGIGHADLAAGILRTPLDPDLTFADDPLRMLRACRFAAKLGFALAPETDAALARNAFRLTAEHGISFERIRDELNKTLLAPGAAVGLEKMRATGLLEKFAPELTATVGVTQNRWHAFDVWNHTLAVVSSLPSDTDLGLRLAALLHDIGKPATRTVSSDGDIHFYEHEHVGAALVGEFLKRLRYSTAEQKRITALVDLHMRYGAYQPDVWSDAAIRRLIRAVGEHRRDLFILAQADIEGCGIPELPRADLSGLSARMEALETESNVTSATSPLTGKELMARLGLEPGFLLGKLKEALTDAVVSGELDASDKEKAEALARRLLAENLS